jgi:hypothetical protein
MNERIKDLLAGSPTRLRGLSTCALLFFALLIVLPGLLAASDCVFMGSPAAANTLQQARVILTPALPTTADALQVRVVGFGCDPFPIGATVSVKDHEVLILDGSICLASSPVFQFDVSCAVPSLPAGAFTLEVDLDGQRQTPTPIPFVVSSPSSALALQGARFLVSASRTDPRNGVTSPAAAVALSDESGYFTFFNANDVELSVKIVDGRPVTGHFWLFVASMTDVDFVLSVEDSRSACHQGTAPPSDCVTTYHGAQGHNRNFIDLSNLPP